MKNLLKTEKLISTSCLLLLGVLFTKAQTSPTIYYGGECLNAANASLSGSGQNQTASTMNSENGYVLPTSGTLRILYIFAEIDYTNIVSPTPGGANSYGFKDSRFNAYNFTVDGHIQNLLISLGAFYTSNAYNYPNAPSLLIPEAKIGYSFKVVR